MRCRALAVGTGERCEHEQGHDGEHRFVAPALVDDRSPGPCGHEWRVSEHVTVRCSLDAGHMPALHIGDASDGIRRAWFDEVRQWRPPEAPMSASAAGVHMRRAHEADDDGHPLRVLLGDRVFVLIALVRSGIEALHSIDPDVDGGLFHSIGGPTGCTLTVGGHEYRVTIEGPV